MKTRSAIVTLAVIAGGAMSALASADNLKFIGLDYTGTLTGTVTFFNDATHQHQTEDVYIGKLLFKNGSSSLATVCADLSSPLDNDFHSYSVSTTNPLSGTSLSLAGDIVAADFNSANDANSAAALQLAVWSALYNGGPSFDASGNGFSVKGVSNSVLQQAATYYKDIEKPGAALLYSTPGGCGGQSQLTFNPAPEPVSLAALSVGVVGLLARRRKARH